MYKYICKSVGDCSIADRGEPITSETMLNDPKCEVCNGPLELMEESGASASSANNGTKRGVIAAGAVAALAIAGIGGWYAWHSKTDHQESLKTVSSQESTVQAPSQEAVTPTTEPMTQTVGGGIAPSEAETSTARRAADTSLGNSQFSEAEKKAARAAALEMIKTAVAKMGQSDLVGAEKELMQAKERDAAEPLIYYNLAIVRLRQKQPEEALKQLEAAFMAGFSHFDVMNQDSDLDPLRNNPKFKELMRTYHKDL
ncbi:MAG: hypothetical protein KDI39_07160 [Pseudomonadales bacterium]|nr:hypothetical protein [Pseudomonadales bacterium]